MPMYSYIQYLQNGVKMQKTETKKAETHQKEPKTVQGLLLSALDMEDEIAHSIYRDYMNRENWPAGRPQR